jgi:hypothetical protein
LQEHHQPLLFQLIRIAHLEEAVSVEEVQAALSNCCDLQ